MTDDGVLELFSGAGGASTGLALLGQSVTGVEVDRHACLTHERAGHRTIRADVAEYPVAEVRGRYRGVWASYPCTAFSHAGAKAGTALADQLVRAILDGDWGWRPDGGATLFGTDSDPAVWLVLPTTQLMVESGAEWLCTENVVATRPLADAQAEVLRSAGYSTLVWEWSSEQYGVPQTRRRVSLIASRTHQPVAPTPTHARHQAATPPDTSTGLAPWRSMRDALPGDTDVVGLDRRAVYRDGQPTVRVVPYDEPAPALTSVGVASVMVWAHPDGGHSGMTVAEAARLQAFPDDHPWAGPRRSQLVQVGNAVPPPMAAVVAATAMDVEWEPAVGAYLTTLYR